MFFQLHVFGRDLITYEHFSFICHEKNLTTTKIDRGSHPQWKRDKVT